MNEKGTTVATRGVKDLLADDGRVYTLTAHCTTDTHMDFMLTPPKRATQQAALVVICGTLDESNGGISAEQPDASSSKPAHLSSNVHTAAHAKHNEYMKCL